MGVGLEPNFNARLGVCQPSFCPSCVTINPLFHQGQTVLKYLKEPSIHQTTLIVMIFAALFAATSAFVVIYNETKEVQHQIQQTKERYIQTQKQHAIDEASKLARALLFLDQWTPKEALHGRIEGFLEDVFARHDTFAFVVLDEDVLLYNPERFLSKIPATLHAQAQNALESAAKQGYGMHAFALPLLGQEPLEGLVYVRALESMGLVLGGGVFLDGLEEVVAAKKEESRQKITAFMLKIATLTLCLYVAGLLKYRYLTRRITRDIQSIDAAFKEAPASYRFVDVEKVVFVEFKEIAAHANRMIAKIREKNRDLVSLNTNLEKIVEEKTRALQQSIAYTNELLKQQDRFVNNAIHEINTPLSIMMMNIELHNLKLPKTPYLTKIEAAAKVLENIYEDLGYAVKKNRTPYPKGPVELGRFVLERIAYFQDVAEGNDVFFTCKAQEGLWVHFSEVELQRIVDNNLSNAIKYAKVGTGIDVAVREVEGRVAFVVGNTGSPVAHPEKLFERYYREDQAKGGFGLGLNIVKEICDTHRVRIDVRSQEGYTEFEYRFIKESCENLTA